MPAWAMVRHQTRCEASIFLTAFRIEPVQTRLRSLQAVDETVRDLYGILEDQGALDNTYIIYTTDNGYHIGQHRESYPGPEKSQT